MVNLYFQSSGLATGSCVYIHMHFGSLCFCSFYIDVWMLLNVVHIIMVYMHIYNVIYRERERNISVSMYGYI